MYEKYISPNVPMATSKVCPVRGCQLFTRSGGYICVNEKCPIYFRRGVKHIAVDYGLDLKIWVPEVNHDGEKETA